jgi:WD40 repeat protein
MRRWFLSYNAHDLGLVERLDAALRQEADSEVFFAPKSLRAGGYWLPKLAEEIAAASAFVLLIGENGVGPWQVLEYYEALDKRVKSPDFPLVLVLQHGHSAPGLPFLQQLHWIVTPDPANTGTVGKLLDALAGPGTRPGELWRYTAPYRGLTAMTEADSEFFFGRTQKTVETLTSLEAAPDKLTVLLGNSGVGKSSLAQAGVLASLKRQAWPEAEDAKAWPHVFGDSRRWCYLTLRPGTDPLDALVEAFLRTWQLGSTDAQWGKHRREWVEALLGGAPVGDLLDATERRYAELGHPKPPAFFLYVDQGEELYARADDTQRRRFSELLARGFAERRFRAMMSLRADFFGDLHRDELLYAVHRQVNVPPLREAELREIVNRPAASLAACFESDTLAADIAQRTAEESAKDAGALPLLSYLLDDMWTQMAARGDGVLRLPLQALEFGGVLAERADKFVAEHPEEEDRLRRLLTLKLATVREDGEPTRRRALRSEFSAEEWRLVTALADQPHRLLVTATPEGAETYAEAAHEAIFRRWGKLRVWIAAEREFLVWKSGFEADRRLWERAPAPEQHDALLTGLALTQAHSWRVRHPDDLAVVDGRFIDLSLERQAHEREQKERQRRIVRQVSVVAAVGLVLLTGVSLYQWNEAEGQRADAVRHRAIAEQQQAEAVRQRTEAEGQKREAERQKIAADEQKGEAERQKAAAEQQKTEAERQRQAAEQERNRALLTQSRFLADLANQRTNGGDAATGMLLALDALPQRDAAVQRPYAGEPEAALWSGLQDLRELSVFKFSEATPGPSMVSPDGRRVFVPVEGLLWDAQSGRKIGNLGNILDVAIGALPAFSADGRRLATLDADAAGFSATIWDTENGRQIAIIKGHSDTITSIAFNVDGKRVVTACRDRTTRIWDAETGSQIGILKSPSAEIGFNSAEFSRDSRQIVTTNSDRLARIWNAETGKEIQLFRGHTADVRTATFSPNGRRIVTGSDDLSARVWDTTTGKEIRTLRGHSEEVTGVAFSRDGYRIVTTSRDGSGRVWDAEAAQALGVFRSPGALARGVFNPDDQQITTASSEVARAWSVRPVHDVMVLRSDDPSGSAVFDHGGDRVLVTSFAAARIWSVETGRQVIHLPGHFLAGGAFSPDDRRLVTAGFGIAEIWSVDTGQRIRVLKGHSGAVRQAVYSPDGRKVATASTDGTARLWDAETGEELKTFSGHADDLTRVAFDPQGLRVLTASRDRTARLWDATTGRSILVLEHSGPVRDASFSPDGRRIVTASEDTVAIWSAETGEEEAALGKLSLPLTAAFSPNGQRILVATYHKTAQLWDLATRQQIGVLTGHDGSVTSAAFSADGRRVVTASGDKTARIWRVFPTTQALVDHAKNVVPRCLTREQREQAFLEPEPPAWCIEMEKWPYHTTAWKHWLRYKRENANPPPPDTPEWMAWVASRKAEPAPSLQ